MRRLFILMAISWALLSGSVVGAQQAQTPQPGEPPIRALITISPPDEDGLVTISGAAGAVFPAAQVAIRNLYTEDTVYAAAGLTGSFTAELYGPGTTPFLIQTAEQIPAALRNVPGSLPGGPGVILVSAPPSAPQVAEALPITPLLLDGDLADWAALPDSERANGVFAWLNRDSLLIAAQGSVPVGARWAVQITLNTTTYEITLDPRQPLPAAVSRLLPEVTAVGDLAVSVALNEAGDVLEARIPLAPFFSNFTTFTLDQITLRTDGGEEITTSVVAAPLTSAEEQDGLVYPPGSLADVDSSARRFTLAGPLGQGASAWTAEGRANGLAFAPGDTVILELDVTLNVPDYPAAQAGLRLIGDFSLQPVAVAAEPGGTVAGQPIAALATNNGWSNLRTPSGLALDNLRGDVPLGQAVVEPGQVIRRGDQLLAALRFTSTLPLDLPAGLYVPTFTGRAQIGDAPPFDWTDSGLFGAGSGISRLPLTRLPLVFNVGGITEARLLWALFHDAPSDGSRGVLPMEDTSIGALSNRVRFNSPTYILPPGEYPVEPYLLNVLPNRYDSSAAPLLPLLFPGGRLQAQITTPNRFTQELPSAGFVQDRISSRALDERSAFGGQSPVDAYRLTTLNPAYSRFLFDAYGEYTITLTGANEDIFGNTYTGGGLYRLLIAEPLDLSPGVLPGTPFEVGDMLYPGLRVTPGVPAEVTVTVHIFPLDGSEQIVSEFVGQANRGGYFAPGGDAFTLDVPGEYLIDYEARYEAPDGRLWAASLRSAGVIGTPDSPLVARGQRGLLGDVDGRQAWYNTAVYAPADAPATILSFPYFAGDVAVSGEDRTSGINPALYVQDVGGLYASWLAGSLPEGREAAERAANRGELPLEPIIGGPPGPYSAALRPDFIANDAYAYLSAVRPGITLRQLVLGAADDALPVYWDGDDVYNQQIGAGSAGDRPGDYAFLFGGAVLRNAEAGLQTAAIYAALAVVGGEGVPAQVTPPYRGAAGGPDGGPLLTSAAGTEDLFFALTSLRPGQVLSTGDTLAVAGQSAPTLTTQIAVRITSPSGTVTEYAGASSAIGYFYDHAHNIVVDESGVWTVALTVSPLGAASAGMPEPPLPVGTLPGLLSTQFEVFVRPADAPSVEWQEGGDIDRVITATNPFNFTVSVPQGWTDARAFLTIATESYVLQSGEFRINGSSATYTLQRSALNAAFPNIERDPGAGPAASDVVTLTFAITGTDETGQPAIRTRSFSVFTDRLLSLEDLAAASPSG